MQTYCLVCKKNTENKDVKIMKSKNNRIMMVSKCAVCGNKKSRFVREQEAKGIFKRINDKYE